MNRGIIAFAAAGLGLLVLPIVLVSVGQEFYLGLLTRVMIYALAATSLNLILGYGGMVSFGHAAFLGIGGYAVAIAAQHGIGNAWVAWPIALGAVALFATVIGAVSLRTQGVHFLMITLALAQMVYYVFVSLRGYGGDDGLSMSRRSTFGWEAWWPTRGDAGFYYLVLALLALALLFVHRLIQSRFGRVLVGVRENEARMSTIGFPVYRYKLVAFVIAAMLCGLAGVLNVELNRFVSPSVMHWSQSGMLMVMVIVGGLGRPWAGVVGAAVFLGLEEVLSHYTERWQLPMGLLLLALVLARVAGWRLPGDATKELQNV
jgi:branched-chain amino acid transport system permease protein